MCLMTPEPTSNTAKSAQDGARPRQKLIHSAEVLDQMDLRKACRTRTEYGKVRWLVSWYEQQDGFWLARLSCDRYPETVEGIGQSRCLAIDSATRYLLDQLHRLAQEEKQYQESLKSFQ